MARKGRKANVVNVNTGKAMRPKRRNNGNNSTQEVTALGKVLRALGGVGGGAAGEYLGNRNLGAYVGTGLGALISRWLGQGDYRVTNNSIISSYQSGSGTIPAMHKTNQSITVRHREYVAAIKGSVDFAVQRFFLLQPGDTNTFPWLSSIAPLFQQYRIKGMVFHYVPTSGVAVSGSNPAIGSVMMQTSYRVNDTPPASKVELLNEYWACEASPAEAFCHPIECAPKENPFNIHYTRSVPVTGNDSPLLYDMGVTYVATSGMPATGNTVGDLWVTYEIEFSKPLVTSSVTARIESTLLANATGPVPGDWFGTSNTFVTGTVPVTMNTRTLTFPVGQLGKFLVLVDIDAVTTFSAMDLSGAPVFTNCTSITYFNEPYLRTVFVGGTGATLSRGTYALAVQLSDPSSVATITFPSGTWTGTAEDVQVSVSSLA